MVASVWQLQAVLFETFWSFFFLNIFYPWLVEPTEAEPMGVGSGSTVHD